jgi:hypothetical protein
MSGGPCESQQMEHRARSPIPVHDNKGNDIRLLFEDVSPIKLVNEAAAYTAPDFSLLFIGAFVLVTWLHDTHRTATAVILGIWVTLQIASSIIKEDFRNDLFWSVASLILPLYRLRLVAGQAVPRRMAGPFDTRADEHDPPMRRWQRAAKLRHVHCARVEMEHCPLHDAVASQLGAHAIKRPASHLDRRHFLLVPSAVRVHYPHGAVSL